MNIWRFTFIEHGDPIEVEGMWVTDAIEAVKNGNFNVDIAFCTKIELIRGDCD